MKSDIGKYKVIIWNWKTGKPVCLSRRVVKDFEAARRIKAKYDRQKLVETHFFEIKANT